MMASLGFVGSGAGIAAIVGRESGSAVCARGWGFASVVARRRARTGCTVIRMAADENATEVQQVMDAEVKPVVKDAEEEEVPVMEAVAEPEKKPEVEKVRAEVTLVENQPELEEVPFELRGFSLANVSLVVGVAITVYSFYEYLSSSGVASASSLGFVYGVPILLIGFALKYAELQPVPLVSTAEGRKLRETKATEVLKKVVKDVTRHRYGDEQHLDTTLKSLGLIPRGSACPELLELREKVEDGEYSLTMTFFSRETPYSDWENKEARYEAFFGPGVRASVTKVDAAKRTVALTLVTITSA